MLTAVREMVSKMRMAPVALDEVVEGGWEVERDGSEEEEGAG